MPPPPRLRARPARLRTRWPLILLLVVLVVATATVVSQLGEDRGSRSRPIPVATGDWAPYVGPDLPGGGPLAEVVTEAFNRAGYTPVLSHTSWQLAESRTADGKAVAVFPLVPSEQRRRDMLLSAPLADFRYVLFHDRRRGTPQLDAAADLSALRVGGIEGYDYWPELERAVPRMVRFDTSLEGFEALAAGEVDLLVEGLRPGRAVLADPAFSGDADDFDVVPGDSPWLGSDQTLHLMVPRTEGGREVLGAFDRALAELRGTGEHARLLDDLGDTPIDLVRLEPDDVVSAGNGPGGLVRLLDARGRLTFVAPRGTRAQVLAWPETFSRVEDRSAQGRPLVRVKLLNGPAVGRVAWVDARSVVLDGVS